MEMASKYKHADARWEGRTKIGKLPTRQGETNYRKMPGKGRAFELKR